MKDLVEEAGNKFGNLFGLVFNNKRRSRLGVNVHNLGYNNAGNIRCCSSTAGSAGMFADLPDGFLGDKILEKKHAN